MTNKENLASFKSSENYIHYNFNFSLWYYPNLKLFGEFYLSFINYWKNGPGISEEGNEYLPKEYTYLAITSFRYQSK